MPTGLGAWLRQQREARGLTRPEMARRLIQAGQARGDRSMPGRDSMCHNIYRWERGEGGLTERYRLAYCHALGLRPSQFGTGHPDQPGPAAIIPASAAIPASPAGMTPPPWPPAADPAGDPAAPAPLPAAKFVAYRGVEGAHPGNAMVRREVLMAAHESGEQAEQAEQRGIGDATLDQMRADVTRLSREYMTGAPFPLFLEMRRVRDRMHEALDRKLWPRDAATLYFLLGCLNDLMGVTAHDLGYPAAAEELYRAGWAYAVAIDHRPLMAKLRLDLADFAYWHGRPRQATGLASSGLEYLRSGPSGIQLHLKYGRAMAELGDVDSAQRAIAEASDAREHEYRDDLTEVGGEFDLSRASERYLTGSVLVLIPAAVSDAATVLEQAADLYAAGPGPDETHGYGMEALTRVSLAQVRLRTGGIEAAADALDPVLSLPAGKRIDPIPQRLDRVRAELHAPVFRGSAQARTLDEQIEEFSREAAAARLPALPAAPG
jgi:transcriptional regulator with XRE-family HTH domain